MSWICSQNKLQEVDVLSGLAAVAIICGLPALDDERDEAIAEVVARGRTLSGTREGGWVKGRRRGRC